MRLEELLAPTWEGLATYNYGGITYYLACEVVEMLHLSNVTQAMGRRLDTPKISLRNWRIEVIPKVNRKRSVYLFTYEGIVEIIRNNNNATCKILKPRLDE